jgi:hypothetical protein
MLVSTLTSGFHTRQSLTGTLHKGKVSLIFCEPLPVKYLCYYYTVDMTFELIKCK